MSSSTDLTPDEREDFEERAGIKEFCAGMTRAQAESEALSEVLRKRPWRPEGIDGQQLGLEFDQFI